MVGNWGSGAAVRHSSGDENVKDGGGGAFGAAAKTPSSRRETDCCFTRLLIAKGMSGHGYVKQSRTSFNQRGYQDDI